MENLTEIEPTKTDWKNEKMGIDSGKQQKQSVFFCFRNTSSREMLRNNSKILDESLNATTGQVILVIKHVLLSTLW